MEGVEIGECDLEVIVIFTDVVDKHGVFGVMAGADGLVE